MRSIARAALVVVALATAACATDRPITWEDLGIARAEPSREPRPDDAPASQPDARVKANDDATAQTQARDLTDTPADAAPPAAEPPRPARAPDVAIDLTPRGRVALPGVSSGTVDDGALVEVDALTLVCVADARALVETALVFDRLDEEAQKIGATLGDARLIRLGRDPARSITDPPPRACRALVKDAALKAPLLREREPKATWLVTASTASIIDDSARAAARVQAGAHKVTAAPRAVVDERGVIVALAIPIAHSPGGS